jgi:hypothetical protein
MRDLNTSSNCNLASLNKVNSKCTFFVSVHPLAFKRKKYIIGLYFCNFSLLFYIFSSDFMLKYAEWLRVAF